ncbi:tRNA guanosine-2'-O-methyltransferase TRM13 [Cladochytrium replicatum]|nr:tRNA guanosine-2'-O-methyltransferase TRM13 [Cladochytrium replicatum]
MGKKRKGERSPSPMPVPDRPSQCHFFLKKKNRYCSLPAARERKYCGEHSVYEEGCVGRIPCPLDPKHTVDKLELERHLAVCNSRPKPRKPYFSENINVGRLPLVEGPREKSGKTARERLLELPPPAFQKLAEKIRQKIDKYVSKDIETVVLTHPVLRERLETTRDGKHALQQASLLGHLESAGLLQRGNAYVELGAGAGDVSHFVYKAVGDPCKLVLVDRRNYRRKMEVPLKNTSDAQTSILRVSMDIKDLDLTKMSEISGCQVVGISKHLCGVATDLGLRCLAPLINAQQRNLEQADDITPGTLRGILIALCCHQICKFGTYVGCSVPEIASEDGSRVFDLDADEFAMLCVLSTWAVCGPAVPPRNSTTEISEEKSDNEEGDDDEDHVNVGDDSGPDGEHWSGMTEDERQTFGRQCKRLLDAGRVLYLQMLGIKARLVHYVLPETSLENCALLAVID